MSYGKARAPVLLETPAAFVVYDDFVQSAGNLHGKAVPTPGGGATWDTDDSGATDFTIDTAGDTAQRTATGVKHALVSTPSNLAAITYSVDLWIGSVPPGFLIYGAHARYVDVNNSTTFYVQWTSPTSVAVKMLKTIAGAFTVLGSANISPPAASTWYTATVGLTAAGGWQLWFHQREASPGNPVASSSDAVLATGGTLDDGKIGLYDDDSATSGVTRKYDNPRVSVPTPNAVIHSTQSARFLHDIALRENAAGTSEGRVPVFEGKHLTAPPATRAARKSRIVVSARRFDVDSGLPDSGIADSLTGSLSVTPRVRLVSG